METARLLRPPPSASRPSFAVLQQRPALIGALTEEQRRQRRRLCYGVLLFFLGAMTIAAFVMAIVGLFQPHPNRVGVSSAVILPGVVCPTGGVQTTFCLDDNEDGVCGGPNDVVISSQNICNGAMGAQGADGPEGPVGPGYNVTQTQQPRGWVGFWWQSTTTNSRKESWANFDPELGFQIGPEIGYAPMEGRVQGSKVQYGPGNGTGLICSIVDASISSLVYFWEHDTVARTYRHAILGSNPANHGTPQIIAFDSLYNRYVAVGPVNTNKHALTIINSETGEITPLTGAGGTVAPNFAQALDMESLGDRTFFTNRNDASVKGYIQFFNRADGQYTGFSEFIGTLVPYPGTFLPTWLTNGYDFWWYTATGWEAARNRLHVSIGAGGGESDSQFGYIEADSEQGMVDLLQTGNYTIYLTQNTASPLIHAGQWIDTA